MSGRVRLGLDGERGFVLLIVLWTLVLLGLLGTQLAARARGEAGVALSARDAATLESAADGGVSAAIFHIMGGAAAADGVPRTSRLGPIVLTTTITNEAGRINPNSSPVILMRGLLQALGLDDRAAADLSDGIMRWRSAAESVAPRYQQAGLPYRPSGMPFQTLNEIGLVLGVTPPLLAALKPHLSLFEEGDVDARYADPVVTQALGLAAHGGTPWRALHVTVDDLVARITVAAEASAGRRFVRSAEVRFAAHPEPGTAGYAVLSWDTEGS
jgi:general secretion pathway protein K